MPDESLKGIQNRSEGQYFEGLCLHHKVQWQIWQGVGRQMHSLSDCDFCAVAELSCAMGKEEWFGRWFEGKEFPKALRVG